MANGHGRERLARLEAATEQLRKELDLLWLKANAAETMAGDVAKLTAWRQQSAERAKYCIRATLFVAAAIGLQLSSGAWERLFGELLRALVRALV